MYEERNGRDRGKQRRPGGSRPGQADSAALDGEIKRRIVREAEKPGAVKQQVAERHGVHVSVLNRWRTEVPRGSSGAKKAARRARLCRYR